MSQLKTYYTNRIPVNVIMNQNQVILNLSGSYIYPYHGISLSLFESTQNKPVIAIQLDITSLLLLEKIFKNPFNTNITIPVQRGKNSSFMTQIVIDDTFIHINTANNLNGNEYKGNFSINQQDLYTRYVFLSVIEELKMVFEKMKADEIYWFTRNEQMTNAIPNNMPNNIPPNVPNNVPPNIPNPQPINTPPQPSNNQQNKNIGNSFNPF